jgi:CRP-like cAMP-binding protein
VLVLEEEPLTSFFIVISGEFQVTKRALMNRRRPHLQKTSRASDSKIEDELKRSEARSQVIGLFKPTNHIESSPYLQHKAVSSIEGNANLKVTILGQGQAFGEQDLIDPERQTSSMTLTCLS